MVRIGVLLSFTLALTGCSDPTELETTFLVTFENVSSPGDLATSAGPVDIVYAPGVWAIFDIGGELFTIGSPASEGVERLAEDGNNQPLFVEARNLALIGPYGTFGQGDRTAMSYDEAPMEPGAVVEVEIVAEAGTVFSFASMFVQSNDVFVAPAGGSLFLFDGEGRPVSGDVTDQLVFYDAGTEVDEEIGVGANQAPRQAAPDTGDDPDGLVQTVPVELGYPAVADSFRLTLTPR